MPKGALCMTCLRLREYSSHRQSMIKIYLGRPMLTLKSRWKPLRAWRVLADQEDLPLLSSDQTDSEWAKTSKQPLTKPRSISTYQTPRKFQQKTFKNLKSLTGLTSWVTTGPARTETRRPADHATWSPPTPCLSLESRSGMVRNENFRLSSLCSATL